MANKTIKGLTVEIGGDTTKLGKALADVEKKSSSLSQELGQINKLLKLDPKNTELLAQKQKVLAEAVSTTEEKLDKLKEAEKQVQEQFKKGEASEEQVRALQREIIATEKKLDNYKTAAKETSEAVKKLGDTSDRAADDVDDLAEKENKAEKEADDLGGTLDGSLSNGLKAVAGLAAAASAAIIGAVEATQEYRNAMGRLDTAFKSANHNSAAAKKTYKELQSVLGDTDVAVEASALMAQFCDNEEELAEMTNTLAGVYARFPDSLPVEALIESANETKRTGQIAGNLADALNWAAVEGETFGVTMKANTKANEEWNKAVESAASAEDYFNLALQECSDEQERQQLIMKTLNNLYGKAGKQYKITNKSVIEANKANEDWNETLAEVGEEFQPIITDVKKFGVTLMKDAKEPIQDIAKFVSKELLPAMTKVSKWVKSNGPFIKTTLVGVTTAMVTYKVATVAATVAEKGLKGAIVATTVAQKALAAAQAATPWGLVATAIVGLTAGIIALNVATIEAAKPVDVLTDEEKALANAADEAASSFRDQQAATREIASGIDSQMAHVSDLAAELQTLADNSGRVNKEDQARAQFILGELNNALGTEYKMVGDVIQQYGGLKTSIEEVIKTKRAKMLLEAYESDYVTALKEKDAALDNVMLKEKEYDAQKAQLLEREQSYANERENLLLRIQGAQESGNFFEQGVLTLRLARLDEEMEKERQFVNDKKAAWDKALLNYNTYTNQITNYEDAQTAALSGNYEKAVDILGRKSDSYGNYSKNVDAETVKVLDALYLEAVEAGRKAELTKQNFENGVDGYTKDMVTEAEKGYQEAMNKFSTAYADAEDVGEDLGDGLSDGMENKKSGLFTKAKSLVSGIIKAMRKEADSHSPARKTIEFGEDVGEGAEIGIENKTEDVAKAGQRQAAALIEAYDDQNVTGQNALRSVAEKQLSMQINAQQNANVNNTDMLTKILKAIEAGQVIALDGDALVGATVKRMDNALGLRRDLSSRGAI